MFTTFWMAEFNPVEHGWFPLGTLDTTPGPWSQWSRTVDGQKWPDLLTLMPAPSSGLVATVALNGGSTACPEDWDATALIAHIS